MYPSVMQQEGHDGPWSLTCENMNQMLIKTNYMTKIWPSELLFYPASGSRDNFKLSIQPYRHKNMKFKWDLL